MKRWQKFVAWTMGLVVVGGLGYIVLIGKMTVNLAVAVLTTSGVVLAAVLTQIFTKKREIESRNFEQKRAAYEEMIGVYVDVMRQNISALGTPKKKLTDQQIAIKLFDIKRSILLWGNPDMVLWWVEMSETALSDQRPYDSLMRIDRLIRLMREELGMDNSGMKEGDLFSLFLIGGREELRKAREQ